MSYVPSASSYATAGTFTRPQVIDLTGQSGTPLTLVAGTNLSLVGLQAHGQALGIVQDQDWSNYDSSPHDAIDMYHSGTGDAIFAGHFGGLLPATFTFTATTTNGSPTLTAISSLTGLTKGTPVSGTGIPAGTRLTANASGTSATMSANATASGTITVTVTRPAGSTGGNAIFNGLIPQYLDALGDGRTGGTILNNRDGMRGLFIDNQVSTNTESVALIRNHGAAAAIRIENQQTGAGISVGTGRSIQLEEYNASASPLLINGYTALTSGQGYSLIDVRAQWANAGSSSARNAFQVIDQGGFTRFAVDTKGAVTINDGTVNRLVIDPTGSPPVSLKDSTNHLRWTIDSNGAQFFYNVSGQQVGAFSSQANSDGYFIFGRNASAVHGFFGKTPVAQQTIAAAATDAATTQTLANSLRTAIINLGLGA